jgi:hypothetical protein
VTTLELIGILAIVAVIMVVVIILAVRELLYLRRVDPVPTEEFDVVVVAGPARPQAPRGGFRWPQGRAERREGDRELGVTREW